MTDQDHITPDDRQLWRMAARPGAVTDACPSNLDLAAYLDGRLPDAEQTSFEAHLAECADCLDALRATRAFLADEEHERTLVPMHVLDRARALVEQTARRRYAHRHDHRTAPWWRVGRWTAVAAALLVTCFIGYRAGARSAPAPMTDLASEMSFGTLDDEDSTSFDLFDGALDGALDDVPAEDTGEEVES